MGKSEILLLIASVAIGIALMVGMVVPIMKDGKDMVETRNLAQEMTAVKEQVIFNQITKTYNNHDVIKVSGTNFLEASGDAAFPYKAKKTGVLFTDITFFINVDGPYGHFLVNLAGTKAGEIDFEDSEQLKTICDKMLTVDRFMGANIIACLFHAK